MLSKDLTVTVTNESEGITLTLKTVSALGPGKVSIVADPGVYDHQELKDALAAIVDFNIYPVIPTIYVSNPQIGAYLEPTVGE